MLIDSSTSAIVTGGASGLGLASVKALRDMGAKVAILDVNPEAGEAAAAETGAIFCNAKATIRKDRESGAVSIFPTADFAQVLTLNAVGTFATITRFASGAATLEPIDGERGAIVCTGSVAAQDGQMGQAAYAAGKAAIVGMTLPIARDLGRFGIRINTILPGIFDTPLMNRAPQEMKDRLNAMTVFPNRFGSVEEYASLAMELCRNSYMNAQAIRIDAGVRFAAK